MEHDMDRPGARRGGGAAMADLIYLDNAATSFPKPPEVIEAVCRYMREAANPGRGSYPAAVAAQRTIFNARRLLAEFLGTRETARWVFALNATDAINMAMKGLLGPGDHVVTTSIEHHAVVRCLSYLRERRDVEYDRLPYVPGIGADPEDLRRFVKRDTKLVVAVHASNVTGEIVPVRELAREAHELGLPVLIDASQSAGALELRVDEWALDMVAVTGHKGLLGPQGVGALWVREGIEPEPLRHGGTGSFSYLERLPDKWPDRMEAGTLNGPAIAGLAAGIQWITERGREQIRQDEVELVQALIEGLREIPGVTIYGPEQARNRSALVCFNIGEMDPAAAGAALDERGIACRAGLHCAPWAHRCIGTANRGGAVRLSVGPFNTMGDIEAAVRAVAEIARSA